MKKERKSDRHPRTVRTDSLSSVLRRHWRLAALVVLIVLGGAAIEVPSLINKDTPATSTPLGLDVEGQTNAHLKGEPITGKITDVAGIAHMFSNPSSGSGPLADVGDLVRSTFYQVMILNGVPVDKAEMRANNVARVDYPNGVC